MNLRSIFFNREIFFVLIVFDKRGIHEEKNIGGRLW